VFLKGLAVLLFFTLQIATAAFAQVNVDSVDTVKIETPIGPVQITEGHASLSKEQLAAALDALDDNRDLLISTDSEDVAGMVIAKESKTKTRKGLTRLLPVGALGQNFNNSKTVKRIIDYKNHLVTSVKNDKIGLVIVLINTAYDSFVWIHATEHSPEVRAAQIIFTTLNAIVFSLDKDSWARTSGRIRNKMFKALDLTRNSMWVNIAGRFTSNLLLGLSIQTMRVGILAFDKVVTMPEVMHLAGGAVLLSVGFTFSSFAWSEFSKDINRNTHPAAKFMVRRFSEIRSVIMGHLAPSGKLLQYDTYGNAPWIALAVSGTIGLVTFLNGDKMSEWAEKKFGPVLESFKDIFGAENAPLCSRVLLSN
jgi:hypothetical protein